MRIELFQYHPLTRTAEIDEEEFLTELAQQNTDNSGEDSKDLLISIIAEDDLRILIQLWIQDREPLLFHCPNS